MEEQMRYIGNKESILDEIKLLLDQKNLLKEGLTLFDAFSGTGTVSAFFSDIYNIVINDNLYSAYVYSYGRLFSQDVSFKKLGFDPIHFFNTNETIKEGFFFKN